MPLLTLHETARLGAAEPRASYKRPHILAVTHLLVQRGAMPESGGVDGVTRRQAFDDLVVWIERGIRPDGEDVLAADLSRVGLKWTPYLHLEDPLAASR